MRRAVALVAGLGVVVLAGCQTPSGPIFPEVHPPRIWPAPPDTPRIRYIGELRGEASLGARATGWAAVRAALVGPRPNVEFSHPSAVAVRGTHVYVADTGLGVVHVLDLDQREYAILTGDNADPLRVPIDLAFDADGQLLVVDRGRAAVDVLGADGVWQRTERWPEITAPVSIALDPQNGACWLLDAAAHACFLWTPRPGTLRRMFGQRGAAAGELNYPTALTWQPAVGLVVADAMNFRVQVFGPDSGPPLAFGQKGDAAGDFARPRDVAIDSVGHIYVLDNQFENVQIFDRTGRLLLAFGEGGAGPGQFSLPSGITIDDQDRIWIADSYNRRVQVFQYLAETTP